MADITVVIPVYNTEKYLKTALDSVTGQTHENIEIIVVDDGSTDNSREIILRYAESDKRIIPVLLDENRGLVYARKQGTEFATGEYLLFLDSDDTLSSDAVGKLICEIANERTDILNFDVNVVNVVNVSGLTDEAESRLQDFMRPYDGKLASDSLVDSCFLSGDFSWNICGKLIKTELLKEVYKEISDDHIIMAEDAYLSFLLLLHAKSYRGLPGEAYYNYWIGRGITGNKKMNLVKFGRICKQGKVIQLIREFLNGNGAFEQYEAAYRSLKDKLLVNTVYNWSLLDETDRPEGFDLLMRSWSEASVIGQMGKMFWSDRAFAAGGILGAKTLDRQRGKIKTIATFYHRMYNGGVERVTAKLIDIWLGMGYNVVLLTEKPPHPDDYIPEGKVTRVILPKCTDADSVLPRIRALGEAVEAYDIDLVVYHAWVSYHSLWDIMTVKSKGASFVMHTHGAPAFVMMWGRQLYKEMMYVYRLTDAVIALSRADQLYWSSFCDNVKCVSNPICFDVESVKQSDLDGARLLWVGRLEYQAKRHTDLISVMKEVVRYRPDAVLSIVGVSETEEENERFLNLIEKKGLGSNIIPEGYQANVYPYYARASIYLSTSSYEGFPTTLVESKAFGVPCVTYELPYLEMHRDGEGMIKVPFADTKKMAEAIVKLLNDDERRKAMGATARRSLDKYTDIDHAQVWAGIIESVRFGADAVAPLQPDDETKRIVWYTQALYGDIVTDTFNGEIKSISKEKKKLQNKLEKMKELKAEHKKLAKKYIKMRGSNSWKIGRALTRVPRMLKRFFSGRSDPPNRT
jgi:glycosyltransferase involved in cell wall biosynthesis